MAATVSIDPSLEGLFPLDRSSTVELEEFKKLLATIRSYKQFHRAIYAAHREWIEGDAWGKFTLRAIEKICVKKLQNSTAVFSQVKFNVLTITFLFRLTLTHLIVNNDTFDCPTEPDELIAHVQEQFSPLLRNVEIPDKCESLLACSSRLTILCKQEGDINAALDNRVKGFIERLVQPQISTFSLLTADYFLQFIRSKQLQTLIGCRIIKKAIASPNFVGLCQATKKMAEHIPDEEVSLVLLDQIARAADKSGIQLRPLPLRVRELIPKVAQPN